MADFDKINGHNSKMPVAICLDNILGKYSMPLNILSKFGDDPMKNMYVKEQTTGKCQMLTDSMAITQKRPMRFGWISNLTKINSLGMFGDDPMK